MSVPSTRPSRVAHVAAALAVLIHVLLAVPLYFVQLLAPTWAMVVFYALWAVLLVIAVLLFRRRPRLVVAIPWLLIALVYGGLTVGDLLLGWTA